MYQRSSVQILTQFTAQDSQSRTTYLLGSADWFMDVTELVYNWLRVEDPQVAALGTQNNLIGLRPGKTSIHVGDDYSLIQMNFLYLDKSLPSKYDDHHDLSQVVSEHWDGVLGSCDISVTSDTVTPGDLSVQVVSGLGMSVKTSPTHPSIITTTVTAYNILYNYHQVRNR